MATTALLTSFQDRHWPSSEHQLHQARWERDRALQVLSGRLTLLEGLVGGALADIVADSERLDRVVTVLNGNAIRLQLFSDGLGGTVTVAEESLADTVGLVPLEVISN